MFYFNEKDNIVCSISPIAGCNSVVDSLIHNLGNICNWFLMIESIKLEILNSK